MPHGTHADVYDSALNIVKNNCNKMVLCSAEPLVYADANTNNGTGTGTKIAEVVMAATDFTLAAGDVSGRKVACAAKNAVPVVAAGNGTYVAYLDTVGLRVLHYYPIAVARNGLTTADTVNFAVHDLEILATAPA